MNPFDFAWMLLKARPISRDFNAETSLADELDPDIHEKQPAFLQGTAPEPDMEEPAAMAPDKPPSGMSPEQKLQALLTEHPELREMMGGQ